MAALQAAAAAPAAVLDALDHAAYVLVRAEADVGALDLAEALD